MRRKRNTAKLKQFNITSNTKCISNVILLQAS